MADHWIERAQSAETKLKTCQEQTERMKEKLRGIMETLGAKERSSGAIDIDFDALAERLSLEHALELRAAIDRRHRIKGEAGAKPRLVISAGP